jgi:hypothetical protein
LVYSSTAAAKLRSEKAMLPWDYRSITSGCEVPGKACGKKLSSADLVVPDRSFWLVDRVRGGGLGLGLLGRLGLTRRHSAGHEPHVPHHRLSSSHHYIMQSIGLRYPSDRFQSFTAQKHTRFEARTNNTTYHSNPIQPRPDTNPLTTNSPPNASPFTITAKPLRSHRNGSVRTGHLTHLHSFCANSNKNRNTFGGKSSEISRKHSAAKITKHAWPRKYLR